MNEESVVIANTLFHVLLFLYCFKRYKKKNLSTLLSFFYALSSIASLAYFENPLYSLFPAGEGAGYAGGITSAAADGIRTAMYIVDSIYGDQDNGNKR